MFKKNNNVYFTLFKYFLLYIFYYCVISSIANMYGISVAVTTAIALVLVINSIRKKEKKNGVTFFKALGLNKVKFNFETIKILVLLGIGLNFTISGVLNIIPSGISKSYTESYTSVLSSEVISTIVIMAIVTPILEEIFFRGIFQRKLMESEGEFKGLVIATCIFGFVHFNIIWSLYAAVIGFFLGCIYIKYDSVYPCAIVHSFFNLLSCIPMFFMKYKHFYNTVFGSKIYVAVIFVLGIGILYYVSDRTWIKMFFDKEFYKFTPKNESKKTEITEATENEEIKENFQEEKIKADKEENEND